MKDYLPSCSDSDNLQACLESSYDFYRPPNPIADACLYGPCAEGVLPYLLDSFPDYITGPDVEDDDGGTSPLDLLFNRLMSIWQDEEVKTLAPPTIHELGETLDALLAADPGLLDAVNTSFFVQHAIVCKSTTADKLLLLFDRFAAKEDPDDELYVSLENQNLTIGHVLALSKLFPTMSKFTLEVEENIPREVYQALLGALHGHTFEELDIPLVPECLNRDGWYHIMQDIVEKSKDLKELKFSVEEPENDPANDNPDIVIQLCNDIVKNRPSLESLSFGPLTLENAADFSQFIASSSSVITTLSLAAISIGSRWCIHELPADCVLEEFSLYNSNLSMAWVKGLLLQLIGDCLSLRKLKLEEADYITEQDGWSPPDVMEVLGAALEKNRLESFIVKSACVVDMEGISTLLAKNNAMKQLLLRSSPSWQPTESLSKTLAKNVTLVELDTASWVSDMSDDAKKIEYYVTLNRFGRGQLQGEKLKLETLVRLLEEVADDESMEVDYPQVGVLFGLLNERPGLWAAPGKWSVGSSPTKGK
eukprot:Sro1444_g273280.2  (535) ;mRNA; f:20258-21862